MKDANSTTNLSPLTDPTITTGGLNEWSEPKRICITEYHDRIEMIYKERSMVSYLSFSSPEPEERVFKIVFSCKDGKWHKSDRIYGEIEPAAEERYYFDE